MDLVKTLRGHTSLTAEVPLPLDRPFTRQTAAAEGITSPQLRWLAQHGFLRNPIRNVYWSSTLTDDIGLRCRALGLVTPEDCVIVDRHAGWLHGAGMVLAPNEHLESAPIRMFRPSGAGRLRNDLADSGERNLVPGDVVELHGLRVTTPLRTAWDLGRVRSIERAVAGVDAMLALRRFSPEELVAGVGRFRGMRWVTVLRSVVPIADGGAQSPPESVLRLRWLDAGLPAPRTQVPVRLPHGRMAFLDVGNETLRYAAEFDGVEWHSSVSQHVHDKERRELVEDEEWVLGVFVNDDLWGHDPPALRRLREGAEEARRRFGRAA